ncbi:MAG: hypothetical protein P4L55_15395 [Syntrophobacteraceae bacterium]|nr:hypothetical protein [Syntrophobacteraceae bacterium]
MPSAVTDKLINALKRTTDRIDDFLETNRTIFGEVDPSPYSYMTFCSFLVVASYAPGKEHFPNTSVDRQENDTEEFKKTIIETITYSVLQRHADAIKLMRSETEKDEHAARAQQQVETFVNEKYTEYFTYFQLDIEELADRKSLYENLSTAFMRDVLAKKESGLPVGGPTAGNVSFGLCLSTTISGLLSFFESA